MGSRVSVEKKRVFVVDDEAAVADTLAAVLSSAGFEVRAFYDARAALDNAADYRPDCLVSDVMMPGMNGLTLAKELHQRLPACRILLITGNTVANDVIDAWDEDGGEKFEILSKPVRPQVLIGRLLSAPDLSL